jgi:ribA/ribD-fused uncharacterized protein
MDTQWPTEDVIGPFDENYSYLSSFSAISFEVWGNRFPTAEHAYQAGKAIGQSDWFEDIRDADSVKEAKKLGYQIELPAQWDQIKDRCMVEIVTAKFGQNPDAQRRLIETAPTPIVALNSWDDTYWGADIDTGRGRNKLGHILMGVRGTFSRI